MMLSVEEARGKVLGGVPVLDTEEKPVLEVLGQVIAEDVYARLDIPPAANSAMDGFALRAEDTRSASTASPRRLKVIETIAAGDIGRNKVVSGTAARIMTGAVIPDGADSVVRFEDTDAAEKDKASPDVAIFKEARTGQDIRRPGEDINKGALVINRGSILKPAYLGVLASLGIKNVRVVRRPRVAILATGNELSDLDEKTLAPGKLYNSNSYSIAAQVASYGGIPQILGIASDREDALTIKNCVRDSTLIF